MAPASSGRAPLGTSQRCPACDADVLFLDVCPSCGLAVAGARPTKAGASEEGQVVSFAEAARLRARTPLPDELNRVWGAPPASHEAKPAKRSADEWVGTASPLATGRPPTRRRLVVAGLAVLAVAVAAVAAVTLSSHSSAPPASSGTTAHGSHPGTKASTGGAPSGGGHSQAGGTPGTTRLAGDGFPFAAALSSPSESHFSSSLMGHPYRVTSYSATSDGATVTVSVLPFPIGVAKMPPTAFLRQYASHTPLAGKTVTNGRTEELDGMPALYMATTFDGGNQAAMAVLALDGHVAYEVLTTGPATGVGVAFDRVVQSFRVVDPAKGIVFP